MVSKTLYSSDKLDWEIPRDFFDTLDREFHFTLDPCCTKESAKCKKYYTKEDNGLIKSWKGEIVFVNPPYGRDIAEWVKKCYLESLEGTIIVLLIPARTDTHYFHEYIYNRAELRFIRGRLKFKQQGNIANSAPFPSLLAIYNSK